MNKLLRRVAASFGVLALVELGLLVVGGIVGVIVYLPGPIDGWFYFSILFFSGLAAALGFPVAIIFSLCHFLRKQSN
jgi:hypothetical protein